MLQKLKNTNEKGFTLIELMIVIAIIGILAAIAIPNFINYRNKAYCTAMQTDASAVAAAVASHFSDPNATTVDTTAVEDIIPQASLSYSNSFVISGDAATGWIVTITDASGRCLASGGSNTYLKTVQ